MKTEIQKEKKNLGEFKKLDSSVSEVTGYGLDEKVLTRSRDRFFSSLLCPVTLWSPPSLLSKTVLGALLPQGVKWLKHEADHLPSSRAKVKNARNFSSTSPHLQCTALKNRDNFSL
jgi:hypothetical protein